MGNAPPHPSIHHPILLETLIQIYFMTNTLLADLKHYFKAQSRECGAIDVINLMYTSHFLHSFPSTIRTPASAVWNCEVNVCTERKCRDLKMEFFPARGPDSLTLIVLLYSPRRRKRPRSALCSFSFHLFLFMYFHTDQQRWSWTSFCSAHI